MNSKSTGTTPVTNPAVINTVGWRNTNYEFLTQSFYPKIMISEILPS